MSSKWTARLPDPDEALQLKTIFLLGPWVEAWLYGIYLCLFIRALPQLTRKESLKNAPSRVFFVGNTLILLLISVHGAATISHMARGFAYAMNGWGPLVAFNNIYRDQISFTGAIVWAAEVWIGDILVIYRCFLIWRRRFSVVILPSLLSLISAVSHSHNLYRGHRIAGAIQVNPRARPFIILPYALYFAQNALTTGLIIVRLWSQLRQARSASRGRRLLSFHVPSVMLIIRIMVESAMIYTMTMLARVVLLCLDHPARYVLYCGSTPITGITFILMAIRTHAAREDAKNFPATPSLLPSWLDDEEVAVGVDDFQRHE